SQRRRPPAKTLSRRVGAKSDDFCVLSLACTPVQAASHHFELIPIALQRGCVEIVNMLLGHGTGLATSALIALCPAVSPPH
ncbi:hypothetical protein, partial [Comamonas testosteroni]|uniref:hypothetical protein n=1 Tax=Comamonas testosteroni TaxID=285 RepID=UPI001E64E08F